MTDPQIHSCEQPYYGIGDFGSEGIKDFLAHHSCGISCDHFRIKMSTRMKIANANSERFIEIRKKGDDYFFIIHIFLVLLVAINFLTTTDPLTIVILAIYVYLLLYFTSSSLQKWRNSLWEMQGHSKQFGIESDPGLGYFFFQAFVKISFILIILVIVTVYIQENFDLFYAFCATAIIVVCIAIIKTEFIRILWRQILFRKSQPQRIGNQS